ncbi:MAG: lytic murein transglycosylase B [Burkholderiales bacterium]|jgi:membrane-bound lytic murein transglycosylase B|nr:lytic murein transglycosylase B [Burkholderiales bacterium]
MTTRRTFLGFVGALAAQPALAAKQAPARTYAGRDDVRAFIAEMVDRHGFVPSELESAFARAQFQPSIVKAMTPLPAGQRSWSVYRTRFINPPRIDGGVAFWARHEAALARAAATFGVPEEYVVAIIGVETLYGRNTGGYRVIDALATLAFDYPRRADFFRGELESFLLLARENDVDVLGLKGSFAGAVGIPQFMPSSWRRYAVDFDGDGRRDLLGSPTDAVGSVANFLREHGWTPDAPVAYPVRAEGAAWRGLSDGGVEPVHPVAALAGAGVSVDAFARPVADDTLAVLVELETPNAPSDLWLGFQNFYAITRYNRSSFYAISVVELANAVRAAYGAPLRTADTAR